MSKTILYCDALPGIPWQDKPAGAELPLWRYTENPVIRRNPLPTSACSAASRPTASPLSTWAAAPTASTGILTVTRSPS